MAARGSRKFLAFSKQGSRSQGSDTTDVLGPRGRADWKAFQIHSAYIFSVPRIFDGGTSADVVSKIAVSAKLTETHLVCYT